MSSTFSSVALFCLISLGVSALLSFLSFLILKMFRRESIRRHGLILTNWSNIIFKISTTLIGIFMLLAFLGNCVGELKINLTKERRESEILFKKVNVFLKQNQIPEKLSKKDLDLYKKCCVDLTDIIVEKFDESMVWTIYKKYPQRIRHPEVHYEIEKANIELVFNLFGNFVWITIAFWTLFLFQNTHKKEEESVSEDVDKREEYVWAMEGLKRNQEKSSDVFQFLNNATISELKVKRKSYKISLIFLAYLNFKDDTNYLLKDVSSYDELLKIFNDKFQIKYRRILNRDDLFYFFGYYMLFEEAPNEDFVFEQAKFRNLSTSEEKAIHFVKEKENRAEIKDCFLSFK